MNQNNEKVKFCVIDKGLGGTTTSVIVNKAEIYLNQYKPDMVIVMMGINDADGTVPTGGSSRKQGHFYENFKTYKLITLIRQHIVAKIAEIEFNNLIKKLFILKRL